MCPLYEYACVVCGHQFEKLRAVNFRDRSTFCPECGNGAKRLASVPALQDNPGIKLRKKLDKKKPPKEYR